MRHLHKLKFILLAVVCLTILNSCSEDDDFKPKDISIEFDTNEYKVKKGKAIEIEPIVTNTKDPIFSWKLNQKIISTAPKLNFSGYAIGEYFVTLRIDDENGWKEQQIKISVLEKLPPEIEMVSNYIAYLGSPLELIATTNYAEDGDYIWRVNGEVVSEEKTYSFLEEKNLGPINLTVKVTTEDGVDIKAIKVTVLPKPVPELYFDNGRHRTVTNKGELRKMTVPLGKTLVLSPVVCNIATPAGFTWTVDGAAQNSTNEYLEFKPTEKKSYLIEVTEKGTSTVAKVEVTCTEPEGTYFRPIKSGNRATATTAFHYIPAPGQFVDFQTYTTEASVLRTLQTALNGGGTGHIGAYGGYWIVGFDHSVKNEKGKNDLKIAGNAFAGWSEPGIVWVMQDENGNGLPDDTWYELKGSEEGNKETKKRYAVTYYKPTEAGSNVMWTDNFGGTGSVDYNGYHSQAYYFPMFIKEDYYTLTGTCLGSTFYIDPNTGYESSKDLPWGYVDNYNTDRTKPMNEFSIEDAIQADGSSANLTHIDFVKVHTAALGKGTLVGEISTEAEIPTDLNFNK